jgi:hypothetical protein
MAFLARVSILFDVRRAEGFGAKQASPQAKQRMQGECRAQIQIYNLRRPLL